MGDSVLSKNPLQTTAAAPDISTKLAQDSTTQAHSNSSSDMSLGTKAVRVAQVTAQGLAETPAGILHTVETDLSPSHWAQTGMMIASSAAFGIALRTILPESGAVKAIAGLAMGAYFLKDGVTPMFHAWGAVTSNGSSQTMSDASKMMGDGLGNFAVDGFVSMKAANWGSEITPDLANRIAPKQWNAIEAFKSEHLASTSPLIAPLATGLSTFSAKFHESVKGFADKLDPVRASHSPGEVADAVAASQKANLAEAKSDSLYRHGIAGTDGNTHGLDRTVSLLLDGEDPNTIAAGDGPIDALKVKTRFANTDFANHDGLFIPQQFDGRGALTAEPLDAAKGTGTGRSGTRPVSDATQAKPTDSSSTTDNGNETAASRILNAATMDQMAAVIRTHLAATTDEEGIVRDGINRALGAVDVRTNPAVKTLLGYQGPTDAMINLAGQVGSDPASYMQVEDLFHRYADAAVQSGSRGIGETGDHVARFNAYTKEYFTTWYRNILQAGIDPNVALQRKMVPPLGEVTSDIEQIGVDHQGNPIYAHQGPHTVRSIFGPNGEPIWPIDLIKIPIRELELRAVLTSGVDDHEQMHDEEGNSKMFAFDPATRDATLGKLAKTAAGADAGKVVDVPNGGVDPQDVLLNNIARQAQKLPADQRDTFMESALQRTPQDKVLTAANAANEILGERSGSTPINVPGTGKMPLLLFVANVAAMADDRSPADVLREAMAHQEDPTTRTNISANVDNLLGANGKAMIPLADGTKVPLKDVIMKVSDATRNPHFDTYEQALPKQINMQDLLVGNSKAIAGEFIADLGAASTSGQTAAPYFQALREDGKLSAKSVMGQEMRSEDNPLGMELHPVDEMRPYVLAAFAREAATAKGGHDQGLLDWANALEKYADDAGQGGPITYASLDAPGQKLEIPRDTYINFMRQLVHAQIYEPLPRLQGHSMMDILPDLRKNFKINNDVSDQWVEAIKQGKGPESVPLDKSTTKITHIYGAGQLTFLKLMAADPTADPIAVNDKINQFSDYFGNQYVDNNPHAQTTFVQSLQLNPTQTLKQVPLGIASQVGRGARVIPQFTDYAGRNSNSIANVGGSLLLQDLLGLRKTQEQMLNPQQ